jgi:(2Fe-2S) ferredoxin
MPRQGRAIRLRGPHSTADVTTTPANLSALMEPYARHVLVCVGSFCSPNRDGRRLYAELARLLQREGLLFGPRRIKRGETPCLGVCVGGPIVVVYPEGIWYAGVTTELLERIVVEHLRDGRVVEEAVFHRMGGAGGDRR